MPEDDSWIFQYATNPSSPHVASSPVFDERREMQVMSSVWPKPLLS